jgi:phage shock protein B
MDHNEAVVVIFAVIFTPVILFVVLLFRTLERKRQAQEPQNAAAHQALMAAAERIERRVDSLEMLLDSELPGWRSRSTNP